MRDLKSNIGPAITLSPAVRTASANGTGVDLRGFHSAAVVVATGTITDGTHVVEVQESDDNSTFTAVADGDLQGTEPSIGSANDDTVYKIGYVGTKRYIRAATTVSGTTSGGAYSAMVIRGNPEDSPVA
jgi:hypothetical protein